jgi:HEAT repeat protein
MKSLKWTFAALAALGLVSTAGLAARHAAADSSVAAQDDFEVLLNAIDQVPDSADGLVKRWPDARERLMAAAQDDARRGWTRLRAISLLSFFPDEGVRLTLDRLGNHSDAEVRRAGLYTLGRTYGVPGDAALVARLRVGIADPNPEVQAHCVRALRWVNHIDALTALEELAKTHANPALRTLAERTLAKRAQRIAAAPQLSLPRGERAR